MSRSRSHRRHHVRHQVKKQVIFLSRTAFDLWHQCRTRAIETIQKSQRFSLMSDTSAAQHVRNTNRLSAQSEQIFGFHVVCGECEGFVVRDGVLRNCTHQRGSWCSVISNKSRDVRREGRRRSSAQGTNDLRINIQPPTPVGSPEADPGSRDVDYLEERPSTETKVLQPVPTILRPGHKRDETSVQRGRPTKPKVLEPVPTILRPGRAVNGRDARSKELIRKPVRSGTSKIYKNAQGSSATAKESTNLFLDAGNAAQETRFHRQKMIGGDIALFDGNSTDNRLETPDALMQGWRNWSESWEMSVTRSKPATNDSSSTEQIHCDSDALMQEWKDWSERWERLVRSR